MRGSWTTLILSCSASFSLPFAPCICKYQAHYFTLIGWDYKLWEPKRIETPCSWKASYMCLLWTSINPIVEIMDLGNHWQSNPLFQVPSHIGNRRTCFWQGLTWLLWTTSSGLLRIVLGLRSRNRTGSPHCENLAVFFLDPIEWVSVNSCDLSALG